MEAVGYDLYCKMLNEAVKEQKGEKEPQEAYDTAVDLDIDAFIPEKYIGMRRRSWISTSALQG